MEGTPKAALQFYVPSRHLRWDCSSGLPTADLGSSLSDDSHSHGYMVVESIKREVMEDGRCCWNRFRTNLVNFERNFTRYLGLLGL